MTANTEKPPASKEAVEHHERGKLVDRVVGEIVGGKLTPPQVDTIKKAVRDHEARRAISRLQGKPTLG